MFLAVEMPEIPKTSIESMSQRHGGSSVLRSATGPSERIIAESLIEPYFAKRAISTGLLLREKPDSEASESAFRVPTTP